MSQTHIQEHVDLIAKHEQDFLARRTPTERVGDAIAAFAGSFAFVLLHLVIFIVWISMNTLSNAHVRHFDPAPYSLLSTFVAVEALILASFILMRQGRTTQRAEERDHLMLQILLLSEKEITAVLEVNRHIARRIGLEEIANSEDVSALSKRISIEDVAQTIQESLPEAE